VAFAEDFKKKTKDFEPVGSSLSMVATVGNMSTYNSAGTLMATYCPIIRIKTTNKRFANVECITWADATNKERRSYPDEAQEWHDFDPEGLRDAEDTGRDFDPEGLRDAEDTGRVA
jgi:hypothetical protein